MTRPGDVDHYSRVRIYRALVERYYELMLREGNRQALMQRMDQLAPGPVERLGEIKVPTLILDDGHSLYDSRVICEYIDSLGSAGIFPAAGPARWTALTRQALGDGLLAEFASVVDAVRCAVAIQGRAGEVLPLRIGINLGDVVVTGEDLLGDGVNIAARLEQLCEPGGVAVSGTAYDHLRGRLDRELDAPLPPEALTYQTHIALPRNGLAATAGDAAAHHVVDRRY